MLLYNNISGSGRRIIIHIDESHLKDLNYMLKFISDAISNPRKSSLMVVNRIIHDRDNPPKYSRTMKHLRKYGYTLSEARKKSLFMLLHSTALRSKGPRSLYIDHKRIKNSFVYAYLGLYKGGHVMYTKYTLNSKFLIFNSWHNSIDPKDPKFIKLR